MTLDVHSLLASGAARTDQALERLLPSADTPPHSIHRAMRHSIFAGGKRLRPVLCLEAARMIALRPKHPNEAADFENGSSSRQGLAELAAALEMIHTYSLIHDDLPSLDNDDLRRGQPTCHVVFGEAIAILAGDALQTLALQTIAQLPTSAERSLAILKEVLPSIGTGIGRVGDLDTGLPAGMIGGQVLDLESEGQSPSFAAVEAIHRAKTGALITTSVLVGAIYASPTDSFPMEASKSLRTFAEKVGLAFQIVDDVLDLTQGSAQLGKTAGKDRVADKATWPALVGIERSLTDAQQLVADAFTALDPFGPGADTLKALATHLIARTS